MINLNETRTQIKPDFDSLAKAPQYLNDTTSQKLYDKAIIDNDEEMVNSVIWQFLMGKFNSINLNNVEGRNILSNIWDTLTLELDSKGFINNPFISFIQNYIKVNSKSLDGLTAESYGNIHNAYVDNIIDDKDLEALTPDKLNNIIFNKNLSKSTDIEFIIQAYNWFDDSWELKNNIKIPKKSKINIPDKPNFYFTSDTQDPINNIWNIEKKEGAVVLRNIVIFKNNSGEEDTLHQDINTPSYIKNTLNLLQKQALKNNKYKDEENKKQTIDLNTKVKDKNRWKKLSDGLSAEDKQDYAIWLLQQSKMDDN